MRFHNFLFKLLIIIKVYLTQVQNFNFFNISFPNKLKNLPIDLSRTKRSDMSPKRISATYFKCVLKQLKDREIRKLIVSKIINSRFR